MLALTAQPSSAAEAALHVDGAKLGPLWAVPFVALLVSIAVLPLIAPKLWHHHYGKVTFAWALAYLLPFAAFYGVESATFSFVEVMLIDYLSFVILIFATYVISG